MSIFNSKDLVDKQLLRAEELLATIQKYRIGVPIEVQREIRDYFSSNERGLAITWDRELE